jgi:hypothetical protein
MSSPVSNKTNYGLGVACVVFLIIAGWYVSSVMADLSSYSDWDKPAEVAKVIKGGVYGGIGFLLALGVNVFDILRPVLAFVPGMNKFLPAAPETVSDEKRADLNSKVGV